MNPYSPPKSAATEKQATSTVGRKLVGVLCISLGSLMLIGGIPQLIAALRMVISPNALDPASAGSPGGYLLGTLVGLGLAGLLVRFGIGRFKPRASKTMEPTQ
jgi:Flp pilus assembly protein TadB